MYHAYKIVGVTFQGRQDNIKKLFNKDIREDYIALRAEPYEYEGEPAMLIYGDDMEIGNIAKEEVRAFMEHFENAKDWEVEFSMNGVSASDIAYAKDTLRHKREILKDDPYGESTIEDAEDILEDYERAKEEDEKIYSAKITLNVPDPKPQAPMTKKEMKRAAKEAKKDAKRAHKAEKKARRRERLGRLTGRR